MHISMHVRPVDLLLQVHTWKLGTRIKYEYIFFFKRYSSIRIACMFRWPFGSFMHFVQCHCDVSHAQSHHACKYGFLVLLIFIIFACNLGNGRGGGRAT